MRLRICVVGACLFFCWAPKAHAVAPIFTEVPSLRGTARAAAALERLAHKPAGMDQAQPLQHPPLGHYRAIVILLQFPPDPLIPGDPGFLADTLAHPPSAYDSLLFSVGTRPQGSMRDYYREVSRNLFDIDGLATRWYTAPHPYSYYTADSSGNGDPPRNAQQMAHDAVVLADQDIDFRQFDSDGPDLIPNSGDDDGYVDGVFVVHAGPGAEETASKDDIYSHMYVLDAVYLSGDVGVLGPIRVSAYTTEPEKWAGLAPHTSPNLIMSIGTFCHEYGHVLGLPDLYDTRGDFATSEGVGEWDLMASGNFNHASGETLGTSPAHLSAWSKQTLGWITPTVPSTDQTGVALAPVESGGPVYRLWTDGNNAGEYFLIENRQPVGFDRGLVRRSVEIEGAQAHGLLIYHVDETVPTNNNAARKKVDIVEAGGAESVSGPRGVQNLDIHRNATVSQAVCGVTASVTGNRGDRYDPWPGLLPASTFSSATCPNTLSNCRVFSQVAITNIAEAAGTITADLLVRGASVARLAPQIDDAPRTGTTNDGDGRAEPGEEVLLRFPLLNLAGSASPPLYAKIAPIDLFTTVTAGDSIDYGMIGGAQADSGTAADVTIGLSPDPVGAAYRYSVYSAAGLVLEDTVQVLLGNKTGICDDFEGTSQRWQAARTACLTVNQWHRESSFNHTPGGSWAWKLGPVGLIGSYASDEDAQLVSQPVRLTGTGDTLTFWQRYNTEAGPADGLSVEVSTDAGTTWTLLHPVPNYNFTNHWSGTQAAFVQAKVPLTGYSGVVQFAFHFTSGAFTGGGSGWWIDDVAVNGNATCATTGAEVIPLEAEYDAARARVVVRWDLGGAGMTAVGIDRAPDGGARARVGNPVGLFGPGTWEDLDLAQGLTYSYWIVAARDGAPAAEYGPVQVSVPAGGTAPRAFALGTVRPNPFNPEAAFPVSLDRDGPFTLRVFRVDGVLVRTLHEGSSPSGVYTYRWDGRDAAGRTLPAGLYLIELKSGDRSKVTKAILLR